MFSTSFRFDFVLCRSEYWCEGRAEENAWEAEGWYFTRLESLVLTHTVEESLYEHSHKDPSDFRIFKYCSLP